MKSHMDLFPSEDVSSVSKLQPSPQQRADLTQSRQRLRKAWDRGGLGRRVGAIDRRLEAITRGIYRRVRAGVSGHAADLDRKVSAAKRKYVLGASTKPQTPQPAPVRRDLTPNDTLAIIAISALTSAIMSLLITWTPNQQPPPVVQADAAASASRAPAQDVATGSDVPSERQKRARQATSATKAAPTAMGDIQEPDPVVDAATGGSFTRLVVITEPAGARVTVNGVGWGVTPITISHVPPGNQRIRVTKAGYEGEERIVRVDATRVANTVRIALEHVH